MRKHICADLFGYIYAILCNYEVYHKNYMHI